MGLIIDERRPVHQPAAHGSSALQPFVGSAPASGSDVKGGEASALDLVARATAGAGVDAYRSLFASPGGAGPAKAKPGASGKIGAFPAAPTAESLGKDPAVVALPIATQNALSARMAANEKDPVARANYARLAKDPEFAKLSPEHQRLMLEALDASPRDPTMVDQLLTLAKSPNFRALNSDTASDVLRLMRRADPTEREHFVQLASSDGFKLLNRDHQTAMLRVLDAKPGDAKLTADLVEAANSPDFRLLGDEAKSEVIAGLGRLKDDPAARRVLLDVAKTPGLRGMKPEDSMAILRVAGGTSSAYSAPARAELKALLADPTFSGASAADQAKRLGKLIDDQRFLPHATTAPSGTLAPASKPKITGPTTPPGTTDKVYGVEIDGRVIKVTVKAAPPGLKHHTIDEIAAGLAATPKGTRDKIAEVELTDHVHPTYPNAYAGCSSSGKVEFYPGAARAEDTNFMASALIHEMGHAISGKKWGDDTNDPRWSAWKTAMAKDKLSPSAYGHTTPGQPNTAAGGSAYADDFAESWLLYQRVKGRPEEAEMRRLFPERFKIMDTM